MIKELNVRTGEKTTFYMDGMIITIDRTKHFVKYDGRDIKFQVRVGKKGE